MKSLYLFSFLCTISVAAASTAYPSIPGVDSGDCSFAGTDSILIPPRREVYDDGRIYDISHKYVPEVPVWDSNEGLGHFLWLAKSMKNGSRANNSAFKLGAHTATHVDAPGHFYDNYFDAGFDVDTLDLRVLNDIKISRVRGRLPKSKAVKIFGHFEHLRQTVKDFPTLPTQSAIGISPLSLPI